MLQQTIAVSGMATLTQVYRYDQANRLTIAAENSSNPSNPACQDAGSLWCQGFGYDARGNRRVVALSGIGPSLLEASSFNLSNQVDDEGWDYDAAGNLTKVPPALTGHTMAYDGQNRQVAYCRQDPNVCVKQAGNGRTLYAYDGEGRRVKKVLDTGVTTTYVYDALGRLAAEYGGAPPPTSGRVFLTADHLGSTRLVTNASGAPVERTDYLPFGDEIVSSTGSPRLNVTGYTADSGIQQKFTGKERDTETGLDFFGARYFSAAQGRFTSPDKPFTDQHAYDPQSWNLYCYVRNNPLRFIDTDGEKVREHRHVDRFTVHGRTYQEAVSEARRIINVRQDGVEGAALTIPRLRVITTGVMENATPTNGMVPSFAYSEVTSADVELDNTIRMPEWAEKADARASDQKTWEDAMSGLEAHERTHADINRGVADELDRSLPGTRGNAQGTTPETVTQKARADRQQKVQRKLQGATGQVVERNRQYDLSNCHNTGGPCNANR
jgi:RHS repeat-associated protein